MNLLQSLANSALATAGASQPFILVRAPSPTHLWERAAGRGGQAKCLPAFYTERDDDSRRCYELAIRAKREQAIRAGRIEPTTTSAMRWTIQDLTRNLPGWDTPDPITSLRLLRMVTAELLRREAEREVDAAMKAALEIWAAQRRLKLQLSLARRPQMPKVKLLTPIRFAA